MQHIKEVQKALAEKTALPARLYTNATTFEAERAHIFQNTWNYVGLASGLKNAGDFFTTRIGHVPVVVLRDEGMALSAFVNVCPHRGSELTSEGSGCRKSLQCRYHGWTFGLDGKLKAARCTKEQECFSLSDFALRRVAVDALGPFVFVNVSPNAESLASFLGEIPEILQTEGVDLSVLELRQRKIYDTHANWKIIVENYLECYHCAVAHPRFFKTYELDDYDTIPYKNFSLQRGSVRRDTIEKISAGSLKDSLYFYIWPNLMFNFYPGPGSLSLNLILPVDEHRSTALYEFLFSKDVPEEEVDAVINLVDEVQKEDVDLCESVHRGMRSGFYQPGPLIQSREQGLKHFQELYIQSGS